MKGAFPVQVEAHAVQLIHPWPLAHRPVMALMPERGPNHDLPEAHEKHEQRVVVPNGNGKHVSYT